VTKGEDLEEVLKRALVNGGPNLVEIITDAALV